MSQVQLNCIGCSRLFATDNLPRTAKCLHTYCERCLKTLTCPYRLIQNAS